MKRKKNTGSQLGHTKKNIIIKKKVGRTFVCETECCKNNDCQAFLLCAKMLEKLTLGVNFTNILQWPFLYESTLRCFSLITTWLCYFLAEEYLRKSC